MNNIFEKTNNIERKEDAEQVLTYRGVKKSEEGRRIGHWWSTNPYYAYRYSAGGDMYVAKINKDDLKKLASDVSLESDYENYFFKEQDPPGVRKAAPEEIEELKANTTFSKNPTGSGLLMKTPENHAEIGRKIFDKKS